MNLFLRRVSYIYWLTAIKYRPLWPYYQVSALDVEVLLDKPASVIQKRISTIIKLAPNERGLYRDMLQLALIAWDIPLDDTLNQHLESV